MRNLLSRFSGWLGLGTILALVIWALGMSGSLAIAGQTTVPGQGKGTPYILKMVSGDYQTGTVGQPLANDFVVKITDQYNRPVSGYKVTWNGSGIHPEGSYGSPTFLTTYTNARGLTSMRFTLGPKAGEYGMYAMAHLDYSISNRSYHIPLLGSPQVFHATALPDKVAAVSVFPKSPVTVVTGNTQQFYAEARDKFGNLLTNTETDFTWTNTSGIHSGLFNKTVLGKYVVTAAYAGVVSSDTEVTVTHAAPISIEIMPGIAKVEAGDPQTYTAKAYDKYFNEWDITDDTYFEIIEPEAKGYWSPDNVYHSWVAGQWRVVGTYNFNGSTFKDAADLTVTPTVLHHVTIAPRDHSIETGMGLVYLVNSYDVYDNLIDPASLTYDWRTTDPQGGFLPNVGPNEAIYLAGQISGTYITSVSVSDALFTKEDETSVKVTDLRVDHFEFQTIGDQTAGQDFTVTLSARDMRGWLVTSFDDEVSLTDETGTMTPNIISGFSNGYWTGTVNISQVAQYDWLTAEYNAAFGYSNAFSVS